MAFAQPKATPEYNKKRKVDTGDLNPWPWNGWSYLEFKKHFPEAERTAMIRAREKQGEKAVSTFRYAPLPQLRRIIRLIEIYPDRSPNGLIRCRMRRMLICEGSQPYTCLSYTWGSPTEEPRNSIVIEEPEFQRIGVFTIRQNLYEFLEASVMQISLVYSGSFTM
ncbi:uncharacterized protein CC84DRAFT_580328 [Paraphaeosphaeria sporulosa]|uniref:Heterokaryon incompatibility domain-containing protein n=1 Tax=Paraphaeosphaeria sporulosa TaxID=1460663 RepID=A0A177CNL8_9PLEO|nr:uncharacterized protein CC84DRAFT_580328 [Paraphaeosphaeria sporulosa]OAG08490.1 hypothetical protein CC84DRAFT_580328 [Paraphaeosphaeria sporulosa]